MLAHTGKYHPLLGKERKNALAVEPNHIARFRRYRCPLRPYLFFFFSVNPKKATLAFSPIYRKTITKSERENVTTKLSVMVDIIFYIFMYWTWTFWGTTLFLDSEISFNFVAWPHDKQPFPSFLGAIGLSILRPICLWSWRWGGWGWVRGWDLAGYVGEIMYFHWCIAYRDPFSLIYEAWPISITTYGPCQYSLSFLSFFFSFFI